MLKNIIYNLTPPYIYKIYSGTFKNNKISKKSNTLNLFDGEDELFKTLIKESKVYAEYGCGESTIYALSTKVEKVISVDNSSEWADQILKRSLNTNKLIIETIQMGELHKWSYPQSFDHNKNFKDYFLSIWKHEYKPDLVLIDGRFRVACFLTTILESSLGTKIIFDDYVDRKTYHIVEEVIKPTKVSGRQALFVKDENLEIDKVNKLLEKFEFVFE